MASVKPDKILPAGFISAVARVPPFRVPMGGPSTMIKIETQRTPSCDESGIHDRRSLPACLTDELSSRYHFIAARAIRLFRRLLLKGFRPGKMPRKWTSWTPQPYSRQKPHTNRLNGKSLTRGQNASGGNSDEFMKSGKYWGLETKTAVPCRKNRRPCFFSCPLIYPDPFQKLP